MRLPYRVMLGEQGFAIVYAHVSQLQLETANMRAPADNTECLMCKGSDSAQPTKKFYERQEHHYGGG